MSDFSSSPPTCNICGEPMPPGEEVFKFHGYSGPCPKPPLAGSAEKTGFDFSGALSHLKIGMKVARQGWNGKGMFLFLVPGSTFKVNRPPLLGIYPEGAEVRYHAHIDMKTAQGDVVPWLASQTDVLANDWVLVP
ncbi:DUF2829 domain-containing protein [Dongia sp.]|uniref:DUF2829 domain-containing protein n=1 Tax=Dongia sp. TaxID=1977262 RepID=UPI0035AFDEA0